MTKVDPHLFLTTCRKKFLTPHLFSPSPPTKNLDPLLHFVNSIADSFSFLYSCQSGLHGCDGVSWSDFSITKCEGTVVKYRAYFNVQLITICPVVKSNVQCKKINVQLLHCQVADCHALCSCKSCLK